MLTRDGIATFSLRKLSQELGVSHSAAYRHFAKKEDLLRAIFIESSNKLKNALAIAVPNELSGKEALIRLGIEYIHFFLNNPNILTFFTLLPSKQNLGFSIFSELDKTYPALCELNPSVDCPNNDSLNENSTFGIFREIALSLQQNDSYIKLNEQEIILGYWSKIHGLATILVSQEILPSKELNVLIDWVLRTPV